MTRQNELSNRIANVLIVDDDSETARFMLGIFAQRGVRGIVAESNEAALKMLERGEYDLAFASERTRPRAELPYQAQGGYDFLRGASDCSPELPVVMMAEAQKNELDRHQIVAETVKAIRAGFCDYLIKPLDRSRVESLLDTLLPNHDLTTCECEEEGIHTIYRIVGGSEKLRQTIRLAKKVAPTSAPVLITGESGTGKELISCLIHYNSKRARGPYIKVNCAALTDTLLESELFGHEKGAFTGAYAQRKGRFEMAHGGTLLLDEISETPARFQAKLLRVLEQQDFERVGGNDNVKVDVRIMSTTNKDLPTEVANDRFRRDLYYRLSGVRLVVPPLRQRPEDIRDLVWHFVNLYARQGQRRISRLDPVMMDIFARYDWPGNVRQLRNVVVTSLILGSGETLSLADVSWLFDEMEVRPQEPTPHQSDCSERSGPWPEINGSATARLVRGGSNENGLPAQIELGGIALEELERRAILDTLRQTAGNRTQAAKALGISDRTLRDKIRRYRRSATADVQPV